ncbi:hypothetical protein HOY82DRAFT_606780 [Tuber indicum]|nr:hypothetical protein HOY82DRAFT_606780 [Tuber indicum]
MKNCITPSSAQNPGLSAPPAFSQLYLHLYTLSKSSYLNPDSTEHNLLLSQGIAVMKWDASADQQLLLAILNAHKVTVDHAKVAGIIGCTPRACEERLKKLRKLAKGWALGDCDEKDGEWGRESKNVNREKRKKRTEKKRALGGGGNGVCEPLGDIPAPRLKEEGETTATDVPAVKENAARLRDQDLYAAKINDSLRYFH